MDKITRLIVADDNPHARNGLRAILSSQSGIEVAGEASQGDEAITLVETLHPDVALLDVRMPRMDGIQAARTIKNRWPKVRVILISMYTDYKVEALAAGADAFLIKGCTAEELVTAILNKQAQPADKEHINMKPSYVLTLSDPQATLETVGGKGMSLAKMMIGGFPVPHGFHITTEAYRLFIAVNDLQTKILCALKDVDAALPASMETVSATIRGFFAQARIPPEIAESIRGSYQALGYPEKSVAVRSSATAEDLPEASFAGQQETFLNIRCEEALLEAVKKCWASLWTARAIAYRIKNHIDQDCVALAVVVQEMVNAKAAGILFTANPMNGHRDEMIVNAAWGLGEAIVGGLVSPDTIIADKATGKVKKYNVAEKTVITVLTEKGTREDPLTDVRRKSRVLKDAQVSELVSIACRIESFYGSPQDIEWCHANGKFYIVQSRPITALPEPPLEWPLPIPKAVLARGSFAEFVPEPVSPLFATLAVPIARKSTQDLMAGFGVTGENSYIFTVLNDYIYVGFVFTPRLTWQMLKASFMLLGPILKTTRQRAITAREKFWEAVQQWQAREVAALSPSELLVGVREIFTETALYYNMAQSGTIPTSMINEVMFSSFYKLMVKRKSDPKAEIFMFGAENLAIRSEKALYDLATWAKEQPELADYLARTSANEICSALQIAHQVDPAFHEFATRFDSYLREYGHAIYDLDFAKPTPADDPAPLVETIKVYLSGKNNPYERQQTALTLREQAAETIAKRLDPLRRRWFLRLLKVAQDTAHLREDSIADLGLGHPQIRCMLHELGKRLAANGATSCADDIYWLEAQEVDALATLLEKGEALKNLATEVERRKAKWQAMRHIIPPATLPKVSWLSKFYADNEQTGNKFKGFGASAGKVTARACVMLGPEDFNKMQPGDAIVAGITTPAWTPLFARAAAIVTDIGGPLSHSSIVAREYGIPAVLATGVGTRRIQDGQMITVDGSAGTVTLHEKSTINSGGGIDWKAPDPKGFYMRTSVVDLMPDPLSPLYASWAIPVLKAKMKPLGVRLKMGEPVLQEDYYTSINDYAYMNANFPPRAWWWIITGMLPAYPYLLRNMVTIWREELHPEYQAAMIKYQDKIPEKMTMSELWQDAQDILDAAMYYVSGLLFATMGASAGAEGLLTRVYNKVAKQEGDPDATALLMGWDNIPVQAEKSLYDLATWCREHIQLVGYILTTPSDQLARQLKNRRSPANVDADEWKELRERFEGHLQQFGHIIFQLDFAEPLPLDNPAPMLENIKMYLRGEGTNPHERQKTSAKKRVQTAELMRNRLKGFKRWVFTKALNWGQSMAEVREDALAEIGLGYPMLRAMLHELGCRFAQASAIPQPEDIFWLEKDEVHNCVLKLEHDQRPDSFFAQVEQRKAFWKKAKQETPPPMIPMKKKFMGINTSIWLAESESNRTGNVLKGVATSVGKVTAPACILHGPEDFNKMHHGDVLVAGTTTPAWTPLFAMASAIVTDIGGPLSHGSIVAREYGIPAVMGTGVATRRIQNGQTITVDGSAGIVSLN